MIEPKFLTAADRRALLALVRSGLALHRVARRANGLLLLDDGMSFDATAKVLFMDCDTIRVWYHLYQKEGIGGLTTFDYEGGSCRLNEDQQAQLKKWIRETLPRTTNMIGAWIEQQFGVVYESTAGLADLLHRLGIEYHKPDVISRKIDPQKQAVFIQEYEKLLNNLDPDEVVLFADAVHPTHAVRPAGCWAPKEIKIAVEQTSGRQRLNIHGAIDLESGRTCMIDVDTVNAISTIMLLTAIEAMYPNVRVIHLFLDNAAYHHAKLVREWLMQPGRKIKLHFIPAYCPHLDAIERLWGLMHKNVTHNKCYEKFADFKTAALTFLREEVPSKWSTFCDTVSDNFRIIFPNEFRILV
jgi:transposase